MELNRVSFPFQMMSIALIGGTQLANGIFECLRGVTYI